MERIAAEQERIAAASLRERLSGRELVETLVREKAEIMLGHAASLRVFMHRAAKDSEIWRRGSERSHVLAQVFETALRDHAGELSHPDPELAIDVTYRFVYAALARRITHGPHFESPRDTSDEDLVRELSTAAANYLLTPPVADNAAAPAATREIVPAERIVFGTDWPYAVSLRQPLAPPEVNAAALVPRLHR